MGRFHSSKRWIEGYKKGIEYYEKALAEDTGYGLAYAGLADNYHLMALQGWIDKTEGKNKAIEMALKALELKPDMAEPHTVLGDLYAYADWNWEMAEKELLQAINLNPNYSTAYQYYSELLAITGRYDKARECMDKALELDPFSFVIRNLSGQIYYAQGNFREALAENKISQELAMDHEWAVRFEFELYYQLGMEQEALESFKRYGKLFKVYNPGIADSVYENEGLDGLFRVKIKTIPDKYKGRAIYMHVMLGEYEQALDIMENSYIKEKGNPGILTRYEFRKMNDNPRFLNLLKKMGLNPNRASNK
jgi:tetratricopeptide (TPR) repeat protein